MRTSIIIAIYKDLDALKLIIDSLRIQNHPNLEIIIAEDNNSIETSDYVKSITDLDVIHTAQTDTGIRKARSQNNAILESTGDYLIFIDGDCVPYSNFISSHLYLAQRGYVLTGRRVNIGAKMSRKIREGRIKPNELEKHYLLHIPELLLDKATHIIQGIYVPPHSWLYNKIIAKRKKNNPNILGCNFSCFKGDLLKINGFDESYGETSVPDDTDIQWRLETIGLKTKSCKLAANLFHLYHTPRKKEVNLKVMHEKMLLRKNNHQYFADAGISTHTTYPHIPASKQIERHPESANATRQPTAVISFGTLFGGMEMDALKLAKELHTRVETVLITRTDTQLDKECRPACEEMGIHVESVPFTSFFSPSIIFGVRKIIKKYGIKNVIFFGASEMRSLYFSFLGLDINLVVRHGTMKKTSKKDMLHKLVYSSVNWHVSICENLSNNVREIIPFGKDSHEKLIYSVLRYLPTSTSKPEIRSSGPVKLLHVARIAPGKGHIDAIKSCKILHENDIPFELHLVGEIHPPFRRQFETALGATEYRSSIILHGFSNNVPELLNNSDIFLFPSSGEGLSNSFIEALAFGLVCISYKNTSFPELNNLGFIMHMAKNKDINDLTDKLMDAVNYMSNNPIPIEHNMSLAKELFSSQSRELDEYMEILI